MIRLKSFTMLVSLTLLASCQSSEEKAVEEQQSDMIEETAPVEQATETPKQTDATTPAKVFGEKTEKEKEIAALLENERDSVLQLLTKHFGAPFPAEQAAVTTGLVGDEGKVLIYFDKNAEWRQELKKLIADSSVSSEVALQPVDYSPSELQELALRIAAAAKQERSDAGKVAGIDPEASEQAIYVLVKEELSPETVERILVIFPQVEFVPVSESTGFTEDG